MYLLILIFGLLGYWLSIILGTRGFLGSAINSFYLTLMGVLFGVLIAPRLAALLHRLAMRVRRWWHGLPPEVPLAVTVASMLALLASVLLTNLLSGIPGFAWYYSLLLTLVLVSLFNIVALGNQQFFRVVPRPITSAQAAGRFLGGKVLDSSALIDGRVIEVAEMGFLQGPLFVPRFVLREMQMLADSAEVLKRNKGRRGLELLEALKNAVGLEVLEEDTPEQELVDDKLLELCRQGHSALVTNDSALIQLARIYGVGVMSIQALAAALRSSFFPGETFVLSINRPGKEPGQGVGYLEDGTMVVVDDGAEYIGREMQVVFTQVIQTQVGRLLFARIRQDE